MTTETGNLAFKQSNNGQFSWSDVHCEGLLLSDNFWKIISLKKLKEIKWYKASNSFSCVYVILRNTSGLYQRKITRFIRYSFVRVKWQNIFWVNVVFIPYLGLPRLPTGCVKSSRTQKKWNNFLHQRAGVNQFFNITSLSYCLVQ